jgi:hypothetical protein
VGGEDRVADDQRVACVGGERPVDVRAVRPVLVGAVRLGAQQRAHVERPFGALQVGREEPDLLLEVGGALTPVRQMLPLEVVRVALLVLGQLVRLLDLLVQAGALVTEALQSHASRAQRGHSRHLQGSENTRHEPGG